MASKKKLGLWANIMKKRARGESPAKPGDEGYPTEKLWKKVTSLKYGGKIKLIKKKKNK